MRWLVRRMLRALFGVPVGLLYWASLHLSPTLRSRSLRLTAALARQCDRLIGSEKMGSGLADMIAVQLLILEGAAWSAVQRSVDRYELPSTRAILTWWAMSQCFLSGRFDEAEAAAVYLGTVWPEPVAPPPATRDWHAGRATARRSAQASSEAAGEQTLRILASCRGDDFASLRAFLSSAAVRRIRRVGPLIRIDADLARQLAAWQPTDP